MVDLLLKKLRRRDTVSPEEEQALREAGADIITVPARTTVIRRDEEQSKSRLLLSGFVVRHKEIRNGERQILEIHLGGDFVDLHSYILKTLDHEISTLVESRLMNFPHDRLRPLCERWPHLARLLWFSTLLDASIQREAMLSLGRRSSVSRLAFTFCELQARLEVAGLATGSSFDLPLSQIDLSEVAGITPVHTNRMLRELRERGLMTFRAGRVTIDDLDGLRQLAEFNEDYLYLEQRPR